MRGEDLKQWRVNNGLTQKQLMEELGLSSRQTLAKYEQSEQIPRLVELAIIALDKIEEVRRLGGYSEQFTINRIRNSFFEGYKVAKEGRRKFTN